jgi:hypothetical protein
VLFHVACYDGWEHQLHLLEHSAHCVANLTVAYLANEFKFFYETRSFIARFRLLFHKRLQAALLKKNATAIYTSCAALRCYPFRLHQSTYVRDVEEEVLALALLHNRIYKKKKEFSIYVLHNVSQALAFSCLLLSENDLDSQMANRCSVSVINYSVSNKSKVDCFNIFKDS